jgi:hypothetical protein
MKNIPKAKNKAKELAQKAKAKFNKYKDPNKIQQKAGEILNSEKAKTIRNSVVSGTIAILASGQLNNLPQLYSEANNLKQLDEIASVETNKTSEALTESTKEINQFAQSKGFGQKSVIEVATDRLINNIDGEIEMNNSYKELAKKQNTDLTAYNTRNIELEAEKAKIKLQSDNILSDQNPILKSINEEKAEIVASVDKVDTGDSPLTQNQQILSTKIDSLQSKIETNKQLEEAANLARSKYFDGGTAGASERANYLKDEATKKTAGTGALFGGVAALAQSLKKKFKGEDNEEKPNPNDKTELKPKEPILNEVNSEQVENKQYIDNEENETPILSTNSTTSNIKGAKKPNLFQKVGTFGATAGAGLLLTIGGPKVSEAIKDYQSYRDTGMSTEQVKIHNEGSVEEAESIKTPEEAEAWIKEAYVEELQKSIDGTKEHISKITSEHQEFMTNAYKPDSNINSVTIQNRQSAFESKTARAEREIERLNGNIKIFQSIDYQKYQLPQDISTNVRNRVQYSIQNQSTKDTLTSFLDNNQNLPFYIASKSKPDSNITKTIENTSEPTSQEKIVVENTQTIPIPKALPLAYKPYNEAYLTARAKIEAFANESGTIKHLSEYTEYLSKEIITNLSSTLDTKGSTMSAKELAIIKAKITAWKYIKDHNDNSKLYISLENATIEEKNAFLIAGDNNPESIYNEVSYNNINKTDFATRNFDGVSYTGSYAKEKNIPDAKTNIDRITKMRNQ